MNLTITFEWDDLHEAISDFVQKKLNADHPGLKINISEIVLEDSDGDEANFERVRVELE
jgi:hypothetical protein